MSDVVVKRGVFGDLVIGVAPNLRPLDLLLEDLRRFPALMTEVLAHAEQPGGEEWGSGGNLGWVDIAGERVHVSDQFSDAHVTLPREQFVEILHDFQRALAAAEAEEQ